MDIHIKIGGIRFWFASEMELLIEDSLGSFLCDEKLPCDVKVKVRCEANKISNAGMNKKGEDLLLEYYEQGEQFVSLTKGGIGGYLAKAVCEADFSEVECSLLAAHAESLKTLGNILRLIPMGMILQQKNVLFFHASQIEVQGKGVLFTAPSGTGKTTQAKLWRKYRDAKIICNDRTLIREGKTYGYPVDGSEPVRSGEELPLGAIVVLAQGLENEIRRLTPKEVLRMVLPQLVITSADPMYRGWAMEQLLALVKKYPIYFLNCVPEESAIQCLEQQLIIDGVIENAGY